MIALFSVSSCINARSIFAVWRADDFSILNLTQLLEVFVRSDYVSKMNCILQDKLKFENLGPANEFDNTAKTEGKIQKRLLQLKKDDLLPAKIYNSIRPTGSQRPRMYGLPKIHKKHVPLRPILSMTGSSQHQLAQWLTSVIDPVLSLYSTFCISDSFSFANEVKTFKFPSSVFLCSFDVSSLFTNVPLSETIEICADSPLQWRPQNTSFSPRNLRGADANCYFFC